MRGRISGLKECGKGKRKVTKDGRKGRMKAKDEDIVPHRVNLNGL